MLREHSAIGELIICIKISPLCLLYKGLAHDACELLYIGHFINVICFVAKAAPDCNR